jgi:hypothetical protein
MSHTLRFSCPGTRARLFLPGLFVIVVGMTGCASMTQEADEYYRQMAYNWRESQEKAKVDELSLKSEAEVLAATGDFRRHKRVQRELDRVKSWDAKCEKQAARFEKAAVWTEAHFHLTRPPIPDGPPSTRGPEDAAVLQASGAKSP